MASNVVIEELSDVEDILCATFSADDTYAYDASVNVHSQDMCITKNDLIDALLSVNDALAQTWIVDSGASFHVTHIKECFSTFITGIHGHVIMHVPLKVLALCIFLQMALMSWFCIICVTY